MNLGILRSIVRSSQMVSKSFQCRQLHMTASVPSKPRPGDNESNPFGINDDNDMNSTLVQGNLKMSEESPTKSEDPDVESRLKKYESWIKQSVEKKNYQSAEDTESVIKSSYGFVRLDKENVPTKESYENENSARHEVNPYNDHRPEQIQVKPDFPKKITAHEFLKTHNSEQKEITKAITGKKHVPENADEVENRVNQGFYSPAQNPEHYDFMDSNEIPKQYQLPNLNELTHGDMWNVLRKSIIYDNEFMIAINKPYGIAFKGESRDCRHYILQFLKELAEHSKCPEILPLHRIDRDTTGVLMFAKDKRVANVISQKFSKRQVRKLYVTITKNCPHIPQGTIKIPIGEGKIGGTNNFRSVLKPDLYDYNIKAKQTDSKEAITKFNVIKSQREYAFVEVEPESGLKHQIRVHLAQGLGCPLLGDHKYSHREKLAPQRLPTIMLRLLKVKQSKVRELPMHLHCSQISFDLSSEFTESKEPIFIHAKVPHFFNHSLKVLGLARNKN